ncbi:hypothetical protein COMNV_00083 [Commensalibacter sp. Nvir]|uniref:tyrosine-protein phosphatase n=1 Tax=Commensalibacter sp. Nvir TaxID=3069817 RepID=UPI002D63C520|nr:hypothetical protein COMNV_00083 [Commensalibacter sp. Nvir]
MSKKTTFDPSFPKPTDHFKAWCNSFFIDHSMFRLVWSNFAVVIPNKVYRCNHPTPARLRKLTEKYHLKTIYNLRGKRDCGSDALSRFTSKELGLHHIDLPFESRGAPHKDRILNLVKIYKESKFPLLIHCKSGADRAGLIAAIIVLIENNNIYQAQKQLSWIYGHFKHSKTGILDSFFEKYYFETLGKKDFIQWVAQEYDENELKKHFKPKRLSSFVTDILLKRE